MSLRIGVDARELEVHPRGVGRVLINLLKGWVDDPAGHSFVLYFKNRVPELPGLDSRRLEKKIVAVPRLIRRDRVWEQVYLPGQIRRDRLDVYFSPSYTLPVRAGCPSVVAIHDISYQSHPEWFALRQQLLLRLFTRLSVGKANRIVCCSGYTRDELVTHYGREIDDKISVVYYAPETHFRPAPVPDPGVPRRYGIEGPYFLFVGALLRRRNIPLLLEAFQQATAGSPGFRLVLIGHDRELEPDWKQRLAAGPALEGKVLHRDYVAEEDLLPLLQNAFALVHPSSYEGFALPVVEAMACGVPVILSNARAMVEVAAGAGRVVDPFNAETLAGALTQFIEKPGEREKWIRKGLDRADRLSWKETASAFLRIIESAGKSQGHP